MVGARLRLLPGVATCRGFCVKVANRAGMAESVSFWLIVSSVPSAEGGDPRATNGGSLPGVLCWETGVEATGDVHCSHSKAPWRCWFMAMVMSQGGSIVSAREWVSAGIVMGP